MANEAYLTCGLKGIVELYSSFPDRLRGKVIAAHATLFRQLWKELTQLEKVDIEQYVIIGDNEPAGTAASEVAYYKTKLIDLELRYTERRTARLREVAHCEPEIATALVLDFEKANRELIAITNSLLSQAILVESEDLRREQEAQLFELSDLSEASAMCTVIL